MKKDHRPLINLFVIVSCAVFAILFILLGKRRLELLPCIFCLLYFLCLIIKDGMQFISDKKMNAETAQFRIAKKKLYVDILWFICFAIAFGYRLTVLCTY